MFEKREVRFFAGARPDDLWARTWDWWARQGFALSQTESHRLHGSSHYARIGLRREFDLILEEARGGCNLDLSFRAQITSEGLIAGAVTAVFLLPVAIVGGAVSYTEYESDARNLMLAFWQFLGTPGDAGTKSAGLPSPCKNCGAALLPDWKVCPYCGRRREPA